MSQQGFGNDRTAGEEALRAAPAHAPRVVARAAALLVLAWLLSTLGAVVAFAGFTVTRDGDRLRIRRGLFARREATVPVPRVRAVRVVEGIFRRPFGLAALRVEVTGYAEEPPPPARCSRSCACATSTRSSPSSCPSWPTTRAAWRLAPAPRRRAPLPAAARGGRAGARDDRRLVRVGALALAAAARRPAYGWAPLARGRAGASATAALAMRSTRLARTTVLAPAHPRVRTRARPERAPAPRARSPSPARSAFGNATAHIRHLDARDARGAWSPALRDPEPVEQRVVGAPGAAHAHREVEVDVACRARARAPCARRCRSP